MEEGNGGVVKEEEGNEMEGGNGVGSERNKT